MEPVVLIVSLLSCVQAASSASILDRAACRTTDGRYGFCKSIELCVTEHYEASEDSLCGQSNKVCCHKSRIIATTARGNTHSNIVTEKNTTARDNATENTVAEDNATKKNTTVEVGPSKHYTLHVKQLLRNYHNNKIDITINAQEDQVTTIRPYGYTQDSVNLNRLDVLRLDISQENQQSDRGSSTEYPQFYDNQICERLWENRSTIDPKLGCCGVEALSADRIYGGIPSSLGKFPWMVSLQYENKPSHIHNCAGVLISPRHVLTAGHCLKIGEGPDHEVSHVTLGVHNRSMQPEEFGEGVNCPNCQQKKIKVACVDKLDSNDLGLIYLASSAPYTEYIRPICLPSDDLTTSSKFPKDIQLTTAGWGKTEKTEPYSSLYSEIKLELDVSYLRMDECEEKINSTDAKLKVNKAYGDICAGGIKDKGTCRGDSGGPLMYYNENYYELSGIVSRGSLPHSCGNGLPTIAANIHRSRPWIDKWIRKWSMKRKTRSRRKEKDRELGKGRGSFTPEIRTGIIPSL